MAARTTTPSRTKIQSIRFLSVQSVPQTTSSRSFRAS
jgi:hypothetical protein